MFTAADWNGDAAIWNGDTASAWNRDTATWNVSGTTVYTDEWDPAEWNDDSSTSDRNGDRAPVHSPFH